jgi:hypothetical protein
LGRSQLAADAAAGRQQKQRCNYEKTLSHKYHSGHSSKSIETAILHKAGTKIQHLSCSKNPNVSIYEAIESVSVVAKDSTGQVLLTASYDNKEQQSASKLAKEFGAALAAKLR